MMNKFNKKSWERWNFAESTTLLETYKKFFKECKNLMEIGSMHGKNADCIATYFNIPPQNVYIVEANPYSFNLIKEQFPQYKNIFNIALGNKNKMTNFNVVLWDNPGASSVLDRVDSWYDNKTEKTQIEMKMGNTLFKELGLNEIDICKIDVEGFTLQVLEGLNEYFDKIKFFEIEVLRPLWWKGQHTQDSIKQYLMDNNFTMLNDKKNKGLYNGYYINNKYLKKD